MNSTFHYKAVNEKGEVIAGSHKARDAAEVIEFLREQGYYPTVITTHARWRETLPDVLRPQRRKKLRRKELTRLTQDLDTLLAAGLTLEQSLGNLAKRHEGFTRQLIETVIADVKGGRSLSAALARHPESFSKFYVAIVKSGEASGSSGQALHRLAAHLEKRQTLEDSLIGAILYPMILLGITLLSLIFLLGYVIPRFATMFEEADSVLPAISRLVFSVSAFFQAYWWLLLLVVLLAAITAPYVLKRRLGAIQQVLLRLPVVGKLMQSSVAASFSRTMSTLLQSGLNPVEALGLAKEAVTNVIFGEELERSIQQVKSGVRISRTLATSAVLPDLASDLISVGEETGQLSSMFAKAAELYEKEVEQSMKKALIVAEPILIVGLGVIVAIVILSVLLAMLSVNDLVI